MIFLNKIHQTYIFRKVNILWSIVTTVEPSLQRQTKPICNNDIKTRNPSLNRILIIIVDSWIMTVDLFKIIVMERK